MSLNLDPELLEALRAQPGAAANPALQVVLSRIDPGSGGGSLPSTEELLSQLESSDPTLALVAKYLANRPMLDTADTAEEGADAAEEVEKQNTVFEQTQRLAQIVQRLQSQVENLRNELEQLRERNDLLAAALGACYLCWGEDHGCPVCNGNGHPGSNLPERRWFTQYIAPVFHTLQAEREVSQNFLRKMSSSTPRQNGDSRKGEQS
jgi:hypothetical protein